MDKRICDLKNDFTKVVDLKNENIKNFKTLDDKITLLKAIYAEFLNNNKQRAFVFGLDSFHFQGKLIDIATAAEATQTIASVLCSEGQAMISDLRGQLAGLDEITIGERMTARWTQLLQATVRRLQEPIV
jgi:hypothetical protein